MTSEATALQDLYPCQCTGLGCDHAGTSDAYQLAGEATLCAIRQGMALHRHPEGHACNLPIHLRPGVCDHGVALREECTSCRHDRTPAPQTPCGPECRVEEPKEAKPMPDWIVMRVAVRSAHFSGLEEYHRAHRLTMKEALTRILDAALAKKIHRYRAWVAAGRPQQRTAPPKAEEEATPEWLP